MAADRSHSTRQKTAVSAEVGGTEQDLLSGLLPMISASIYCHGCIDTLLSEVILPFWKATKAFCPQSSLWVSRYARGGQHLKVRLYLPREEHNKAMKILESLVEMFFSRLSAPAGDGRDAAAYLPPIDPEDYAEGLRPDRNLVWTRYRYLPEQVGAEPLSSAIGFETAFVRCRAASTEVMLCWLDDLGHGGIAMRKRMALALQLFLVATLAVHSRVEARIRYLTFQRDWLLRVIPDREQVLALLERKVEALVSQRENLNLLVADRAPNDGVFGSWSRAVSDFVRFCLRQTGRQDLVEVDGGGSQDPICFAISRLIHNAINPIGIGILNEAYLCHLLTVVHLNSRSQGGPIG